jgi:signal transduction histidine kinase
MTLDLDGRAGQRASSVVIQRRSVFPGDSAPLGSANRFLRCDVPAYPGSFDELTRTRLDRVASPQLLEEAMPHRRKLEVIGQLTAGVAHDFNNLLTAIMGNLMLLVDRLEDKQSRRLAQRSLSAAEHAATVTKRLLAFSRRQQLQARRVNINRVVAAVAPRLRDLAGRAIDVEVIASTINGLVRLEPIGFELALFNLVANARDAMPDGGRIVIETSWVSGLDGYPNVALGDWAVICVTDTGCGMPPDVVARAFEPFFTTKRVGAGTGLGLSMVRDVVKQLGGEIAIQSQVGAGTSVLIYLPRSPATASGARRTRQIAASKDAVCGR